MTKRSTSNRLTTRTARRPRPARRAQARGDRLEGTDVLDIVRLDAPAHIGDVFYTKLLNPANWTNTHAKMLSSLYEKMHWESLVVTVRSFAGTDVGGGYIGAMFIDAHTRLPNTGPATIIKFESQEHHMNGSMHGQKSMTWFNPEREFVDTARYPDMGKFCLAVGAYPTKDVQFLISVKWVARFIGRTVQEFDVIDDFTIKAGTLFTLPGGEPERTGGCVNYSEGTAAMDLKAAYDGTSFDDIYKVLPPLDGPYPAAPVRFTRSSNFAGHRAGFVFYSTLRDAVDAGSNPNRSTATGFVKLDSGTQLVTVPQLKFHRVSPEEWQ